MKDPHHAVTRTSSLRLSTTWPKGCRPHVVRFAVSGFVFTLGKQTTYWQEVDRRFSAFAQAICANPEKVEAVIRDFARNNIANPIMEVLLWRYLKVSYYAASFAHKMIVLIYCCIVTMKPLSKIEFLNLSLSSEDVEVSIHCAKRDAGYLRTYLLMHPFCRRMSDRFFQDLIDFLALSASLCSNGLHSTTS
jgi:hypothetical protein